MSNLYDDFEKRFNNAWFCAGWVEVDSKTKEAVSAAVSRKSLDVLESELTEIQENMELIAQKKLRLSNLSKFYQV